MTTKRGRRPSGLFIGLSTLDVIQLVDRVPEADEKIIALDISVAAGGPATNAAVAFAALGGHATLLTRISTDPVGALVAADLETHQVSLINADSDSSTQTTVASILVTKLTADRAVISAADRGRSDLHPEERRYEDLIDSLQPDVVVVDSYETDISIPVTRAASADSIPVILDCGDKKPYTDQQLGFVSVAVVSERYRSDGTTAIVKDIHSQGVPFAAITAGPDPITFWTPASDVGTIPVPTVEAVDTLGAGDFFHGALAYFIARDGLTDVSFGDALVLAAEVSGLSVQSFGSRSWLTKLKEIEDLPVTYTMAYDFTVHDRADRADTERFEKEFPTLDEAETAGMHIGCTRGCSRVEVFSPDGTLQALWDKESTEVIRRSYGFDDDGREIYDDTHMSNRWQRLGDESKALGKRHYDESGKEMQKAMKEKNRG